MVKVFTINSADQLHVIKLVRSGHYRVEIKAEGARVEIRGDWLVRGKTKTAITLEVIHAARHTHSNTLLRGVVDDQAQLQLQGTIIVEPGAQDTNAFLTENILLLSDRAVAHAIPNLEISANEVKCSHAATVSPIPEEYLFYLQSRGLTRKTAQKMIVDGFLAKTTANSPA